MFTKLLKPQPRRRHRGAHPTAHRWEPCEICWVVEMLRSEDKSDHEVVGEAGEGLARVGGARGSSDGRDITARGSHVVVRCVGGHVKGVACAPLCVEASEKSVSLRSIKFEIAWSVAKKS